MAEIARAAWACMPRRDRIVPATGQKMRLAEIGQEERMVSGARRLGIRKRLLYEDHALLEAARQRIRVPEMRGRDVKEIPHLGHSAHLHGVLERRGWPARWRPGGGFGKRRRDRCDHPPRGRS